MADRRITIEAELDASGVVRGSSVLVDQFGRVISTLRQQGAVVQQETNKSVINFERFANAPARGISVLDALNATVLQATNGFQGLGVASTAASVGLRAALFSVASMLTPTTIIVGGLVALAGVLTLTALKADKTAESFNQLERQISINVESVKELAEGTDKLSAAAGRYIKEQIRLKELTIQNLTREYEELAKVVEERAAKGLDRFGVQARLLKSAQADLAAQVATLREEIEKLQSPSGMQAAGQERMNELLKSGLASDVARSVSIDEYTASQLRGVGLQQQFLSLQMQSVGTEREAFFIYQQTLASIQKELEFKLSLAETDQERANAQQEAANSRLAAEKQYDASVTNLNEKQLRQARELEAQYRSVASVVAGAFVRGFHDIEGAFRSLMERIAQEFIESQIVKLLGSLAGGGGGGGKLGRIFGGAATGFSVGGVPGAIVGGFIGGFSKPAAESAPPQFSSMSPAGPVTINIQALDRRSMEKAVRNELMPIITKMLTGRQVAF